MTAEKRQIRVTSDGSPTVWDPNANESFHSRFGAVQESEWIFIKAGLNLVLERGEGNLNILEIGMGSGLNVLLTINTLRSSNIKLMYDTVEMHPLSEELYCRFSHDMVANGIDAQEVLKVIHESNWGEWTCLENTKYLRKLNVDAVSFEFEKNTYDLIYFDAFSPARQPEMWSESMLGKMASALTDNGVFVTYCSKGDVQRILKDAGLTVERLDGPPGKRHIIRAIKKN